MTRDEIIAAMADAVDRSGQRHGFGRAEAALDALLQPLADMIAEHGLGEALLILSGRDRRLEITAAAIKAIGAEPQL